MPLALRLDVGDRVEAGSVMLSAVRRGSVVLLEASWPAFPSHPHADIFPGNYVAIGEVRIDVDRRPKRCAILARIAAPDTVVIRRISRGNPRRIA